MFVHGGSWASGSKELFAHLGAYLAHRGVITVLVQYTLFPEVLALQQVQEVSQALTWIFDNIEHYGGDSQRVTLMGHSAGAHLCALSIWERFKTAHLLKQRLALEAISCSSEPLPEIDGDYLYRPDMRQPHNFIGLAGVYDISEHLKHEQKRGVDSMSSMTSAMGGEHLFETMSPVHLFHNFMADGSAIYLRAKHNAMSSSVDDVALDDNASCSEVTDAGVSMSNGIEGNGGKYVERSEDIDVGSCPAHGVMQGMHHTLLPYCTLFCSSSDTVVRPDTSIAFHSALKELGHRSELIVFENLEHSNFIVLDGPLPDQASLRRHILQIVQP
ncbi:hypothetical protein KP509_1Z115400 [Ceratopteris richardii]|nr:hypothetical protein KP509_1Z115400 [Ceratopteris richardii]